MFNMESRYLLNLSVQNALDCISENFNLKNFPRGAGTRNSLEKCAVCSPDGRYCAHIATVYYISRLILSQNPLSAPGKVVFSLLPIYLFIYSFVHTSYCEVLLQDIIYNMYLSLKSMYTVSFSNFRWNTFLISCDFVKIIVLVIEVVVVVVVVVVAV